MATSLNKEQILKKYLNEDGKNTEAFVKTLHANKIMKHDINSYCNKFARWGIIDPYNALTGTREYIFFVKPDLHLYGDSEDGGVDPNKELTPYPIFKYAYEAYPEVLAQLQASYNGNSSPFCNLLTNTVTSTLDLPNITAKTVDTSSNMYGIHTSYRFLSVESDNDEEFSLEFKDTKYLDVYMFFRLFDEYSRLKYFGVVSPTNPNYIRYKILHDQFAVYKFIVSDDGQTLIHWSKWTGVYPTNVPRDTFSNIGEDNGIKFTINFKAAFVKDMDPFILREFNYCVAQKYAVPPTKNLTEYGKKYTPVYDAKNDIINGELVTYPYIEKIKASKGVRPRYLLRWR